MGCHANINHYKFPKQGDLVGQQVEVCFGYDTRNTVKGKCVRQDFESPDVSIFALDDGRYVLSTECHYRIIN